MRRRRRLFKFASALCRALLAGFLLFNLLNARLYAQAPQIPTSSSIPDAPEPQTPAAQQPAAPQPGGTAVISGTIVDTNGGVIQGARVALRRPSGSNAQIMQSGGDGQFTFSGLPPGPYKLTVTVKGMSTYASPEIQLQPGEVRILP